MPRCNCRRLTIFTGAVANASLPVTVIFAAKTNRESPKRAMMLFCERMERKRSSKMPAAFWSSPSTIPSATYGDTWICA